MAGWKLSNNRWKSCLGGRGRRRKKFEKGISIVLFPPSESARFHYPWNRRSIIIPRQCSIQSHGRLFHFEESISCRRLSSLRSWEIYWWHGSVENLFERPFKNKTWLIMYLLEIINSIIFFLNLFIPLKEE